MAEIKEIEKQLLALREERGSKTIARIMFYRGDVVLQVLDISIHPVDRYILKTGKLSARVKKMIGNSIDHADSFRICDITRSYFNQFNNEELYDE